MPTAPRSQSTRPKSAYDVVGLIKGLSSPEMKKVAMPLRMQILINILLSFINNGSITKEVFAAGFESLSNELKNGIGIQTP